MWLRRFKTAYRQVKLSFRIKFIFFLIFNDCVISSFCNISCTCNLSCLYDHQQYYAPYGILLILSVKDDARNNLTIRSFIRWHPHRKFLYVFHQIRSSQNWFNYIHNILKHAATQFHVSRSKIWDLRNLWTYFSKHFGCLHLKIILWKEKFI